MADYVTLLGAEAVQHAASSIRSSADMMHQAANIFSEAVTRLERVLSEHAERIERTLEPQQQSLRG